MRRSFRQKLALGLFGLLFALLVGEVAARLILASLPDPADSLFIRDPDCTWRFRPSPAGKFAEDDDRFINNLGFRDRNHQRTKPAGTYRVLGIGDSFVYGAVSVRDNFLRVAENSLNRELAADSLEAEILLMGCPGYSTENELGLLKGMGLDLQPDLVVMNFFVGNDVTGLPIRGKIIRGRKYYVGSPIPWLHALRRSQLFMLGESLFVRELRQKLLRKQNRRLRHTAATPTGAGPTAATNHATAATSDTAAAAIPVSQLYLKIMRNNLPVYRRDLRRKLPKLWREAEEYLSEFDRVCRQADIPWLLVIIPGEIQVDPLVREQVLTGMGHHPADYDFNLPQKRLVDFARVNDIQVLDLLPRLREAHVSDQRLYVPNDTHWNERGNRLVGEILADWILTKGRNSGSGMVSPDR